MDFGSQPTLLRCILDAAPGSYCEIHGLSREACRIASQFMSPRVKRLELLNSQLERIFQGCRGVYSAVVNRICTHIVLGHSQIHNIFYRYIFTKHKRLVLNIGANVNWIGDLLEIKFTSGGDQTVINYVVDNGTCVDIYCYTVPADFIYRYRKCENNSKIYVVSDIVAVRQGGIHTFIPFEDIITIQDTVSPRVNTGEVIRILPRPQTDVSGYVKPRSW